MRILKRIFFILAIILALLISATSGLIWWISRPSVQTRLKMFFTEQMSERLGARISIGDISVSPFAGHFDIHQLMIYDKQERSMLHIDTLEMRIDIDALWNRNMRVSRIGIHGATANIFKECKDSVANYQFIIDTVNRNKSEKKKNSSDKKDSLDINIERINVTRISLHYRSYKDSLSIYLHDATALHRDEEALYDVNIDSLRLFTENFRPHKKTGKKHRGDFDAGHIDAVANIKAKVSLPQKGNDTEIQILSMNVNDHASGLKIDELRTTTRFAKEHFCTDSIHLIAKNTRLSLSPLNIEQIPVTTDSSTFFLNPVRVEGHVVLQDISRPFAPPLSHFTTPLELTAIVSGTPDRILYDSINISTTDKRLRIRATGKMTDVTKKQQMQLHFNNIHMTARNGIKEQIIRHFKEKVRMKMIRQIKALGNIAFDGHLDVLYKKVQVGGKLHNEYTSPQFEIIIDSRRKRLTGTLDANFVNAGVLFKVKNLMLGNLKAKLDFDLQAKGKRGNGRLPIGECSVIINKARYGILKAHDISAHILSNGKQAEGEANAQWGLVNVTVPFTYIQTTEEQKLNVNPHFRLGKKKKEKKEKKVKENKKTD